MSPGFVRSPSIIQSLQPRSYEGFTQQTCLSCGRYTVRADLRQMALRSESAHPDRVHGPTLRSQETLTSCRVRNWTRIDRGYKAHGGETLRCQCWKRLPETNGRVMDRCSIDSKASDRDIDIDMEGTDIPTRAAIQSAFRGNPVTRVELFG